MMIISDIHHCIEKCPASVKSALRPKITQQKGLTLIEIMIVVAIIGILASFAVPSYSNFMLEQRRADAHHLLRANAHYLQRCLTLAGSYDSSCNLMMESQQGFYKLDTQTLTAQTWELSVVAVAGGVQQQDTKCTAFTLNHLGQKTATGIQPDACW